MSDYYSNFICLEVNYTHMMTNIKKNFFFLKSHTIKQTNTTSVKEKPSLNITL